MAARYPARSTRNVPLVRYGDPVPNENGTRQLPTYQADEAAGRTEKLLADEIQDRIVVISRNRDKAVDIMSRNGSRRVLHKCCERIEREFARIQAMTDATSADEPRLSSLKSLVTQLGESVEDIVDEIQEHLETRENQSTISEVDSLATIVHSQHEQLQPGRERPSRQNLPPPPPRLPRLPRLTLLRLFLRSRISSEL